MAKFLQSNEHGECAFKLAVKVNLVTTKLFQFVGIKRLAKSLGANE